MSGVEMKDAIQKIIDGFDFESVQRAMCIKPEKWGGVATIAQLKDEARKTLEPVAKGECEWMQGRFLATTEEEECGLTFLVLSFPLESGSAQLRPERKIKE